jgi:hypothetical protein
MNRVADKNGILAATRYRETAVCGSGEGASSPHQRFAYREPMSTARRATPVAAATRYCVAADCGSSRLLPFPHHRFAHRVMAAVILAPTIRCGEAVWCESVMVATIRFVAFLASHPAKPNARPCGT